MKKSLNLKLKSGELSSERENLIIENISKYLK